MKICAAFYNINKFKSFLINLMKKTLTELLGWRDSLFTLIAMALLNLFSFEGMAQTNPTTHNLNASNYSFTALGSATLPASMAVHRFGTTAGTIPTTRTTANGTGDLPSAGGASGGWSFQSADGIGLLASGSQAAGAVVVALNTTGRTNIEVSWLCRTILQQASRDHSMALQYRVGTTGVWTNVGTTSTYTSQGKLAGDVSGLFTEVLPAAANDEAVVQVRWLYWESNGTSGSRDRIAVDDITISSELSANPSVNISNNGTQIGSNAVLQGTDNHILSTFTLTTTGDNTNLEETSFGTSGTYQSSDVNDFKLWYSETNNFVSPSPTLLGGLAALGSGESLNFVPSPALTLSSGSTRYFWITADINPSAIEGRTIIINAISGGSFEFEDGTDVSGSAEAAGAQTISASDSPNMEVSSLTAFGDQCLDGTYGPNEFTITGVNLVNTPIYINALAGYTYCETPNGLYTNDLTLANPGGDITPIVVFVKFSPISAISYSGDIVVSSVENGEKTVAANGAGISVPAILSQPNDASTFAPTASTFSINTSGVSTYLWQVNSGSGWGAASGTNNMANYNTGATNLGMNNNQYRCIVSNSCGSDTTLTVILSVNPTAVSIWTNPITDSAPYTYNPFTLNQTVNSNITVSGIGRGTGISGNAASGRYNAAGWDSPSLDANDYFYFTLTPNAGYEIDFASFNYNAQLSNGPLNLSLRSSLDNYTTNIGTPTITGTTISLAIPAYQNIITSITFRLYGWGSDQSGRTYSINDFTFNGLVNCIAPLQNTSNIVNLTSESNSVSLDWNDIVDADGYVVVIRTSNNDFSETSYSNPSGLPIAATAPWSNNDVVHVGSTSSAIIEGLDAGVTYHFKVYAYNNCTSVFRFNNSNTVNNPVTFTTNPGNEIDVNSISYEPFCNTQANNISVSFTTEGTFIGNFKVQLSDASGAFPPNTTSNIIGAGSSSPINAVIPILQIAGTNYRVRVVNDSPSTYGTDNQQDITLSAIPSIFSQPIDQLVTPSSLAGFTVVHNAGNTFVWEEFTAANETWSAISNGGIYNNANTSNLSIINPPIEMNGNRYRCVVSNNCGTITTDDALLSITVEPIIIWNNEITGTNPGGINPYTQGQTSDMNIAVSGIGRSGISPSGSPTDNRYNTQGWDNASVDLNRYIYFTLDANSGYEINFAALNFTIQRSGTGPTNFVVRSSQNNYTTNLGTGVYNTATTNHSVSLTNATFQNIEESITFRLYAYGASGVTGTLSVNDFSFTGHIGIVCNPPVQLNVIPSVNTAYLDWEAPEFNPLNGYHWEVRTSAQNILKASGNSLITAANANGLASNTSYRLFVYSLCGGEYQSDAATFDFTTGSGISPVNDNYAANSPVLNSPNYVYPNCFQISGSTLNSTPSGVFEDQETGEDGFNDVWYRFNAITNGVSITVQSQIINAVIYLLDADLNIVDEENISGLAGIEKLNYGSLLAGHIYYIVVANAGGITTDGGFNICIQNLKAPACSQVPSNGYSLCSTFKPAPTGATSIQYNFVDADSISSSIISTGPISLSNASLRLQYGNEYDMNFVANYVLQNGLGENEVITVVKDNACTIQIAPQPNIDVRATQRCSNGATLLRSTYLQASPVEVGVVCGITGYQVEFTATNDCDDLVGDVLSTFVKTINTTNASITLNSAFSEYPLSNNPNIGYWIVRWRPIFHGDISGQWGNPHVIAVNGTSPAGMSSQEMETMRTIESSSTLSAAIYPNPNNGDMLNLNVTGLNSQDVFVKIMDGMGRVVYTERYAGQISLNTFVSFGQPLTAGIYMIEFISGNEKITQRMIVSK